MRNGHWVCKVCSGFVWKGLSALRSRWKKKKRLKEHDDGNLTVSSTSALLDWNLCVNVPRSFSSETIYFSHRLTFTTGMTAETKFPLTYFSRLSVSEGDKSLSQEVPKNRWPVVLYIYSRRWLPHFTRTRGLLYSNNNLCYWHEWPLISIHPKQN